mgnify:CR=1 FL=1
MEFCVTEKDIARAWNSSTGCPVAMALRRIFDTNNVCVRTREVDINGNRYDLPQAVYAYVLSYDTCGFVRPMKCKWKDIESK